MPKRFTSQNNHHHVIIRRSARGTNNDATLLRMDPIIYSNNKTTIMLENNQLLQENVRKIHKWSKYRRKSQAEPEESTSNKRINQNVANAPLNNNNKLSNLKAASESIYKNRHKRSLVPAIFVETAVFVDRDLHKHMVVNYPKDTERELVRFVLAMINAVQLLYHDPTLGQTVNFVLKRLEILHEDPAELKRPHDIDRFLSNFCAWQRLENPTGDTDPLHWDHALILTGLDLYVVSKHGKVSSQVVGESMNLSC